MSATLPIHQSLRLRLFTNALLVLTLVFAQWWLLHHESDVASHPDDVPCEVCLALQSTGDALPISGAVIAADLHGDKHTRADAGPLYHWRPAIFRIRGPPAKFS